MPGVEKRHAVSPDGATTISPPVPPSDTMSATGAGEYFVRVGAGQAIAARVALLGEDIGAATDAVLADIVSLGGTGGLIVVA
ncbi:MAG: hypothetical protein EOP68_01660, partial [Sphingomonas sp.]